MGFLILFVVIMLGVLIVAVAFIKLVGTAIELVWGLCKLLWALGSLVDKLFVRAIHEVEEERAAAQQQLRPSPGLRLVSSYGRRTNS